MKTNSQTLFNQVDKTTNPVDETMQKVSNNGQQKTFGIIDMWNIHCQKKSTTIR